MSCQWMIRVCTSALIALCASCTYRNAIALAPGSTPDSLFFVVSGPDANGSAFPLLVVRCMDGQPMWTVTVPSGELIPPNGGSIPPNSGLIAPSVRSVTPNGGLTVTTVRNGPVDPAVSVQVRPAPLLPDCYEALVPGAAPLQFEIDLEGRVVALR